MSRPILVSTSYVEKDDGNEGMYICTTILHFIKSDTSFALADNKIEWESYRFCKKEDIKTTIGLIKEEADKVIEELRKDHPNMCTVHLGNSRVPEDGIKNY